MYRESESRSEEPPRIDGVEWEQSLKDFNIYREEAPRILVTVDDFSGCEECLKWQMSLFPGGVFSIHEKYCFATVNPLCL